MPREQRADHHRSHRGQQPGQRVAQGLAPLAEGGRDHDARIPNPADSILLSVFSLPMDQHLCNPLLWASARLAYRKWWPRL